MAKLDIEKAHELGFCFGVKRAIKLLEAAARERKRIKTLGPVVHNQLVVDELAMMGVEAVENLDQLQDETIAIASHGVSPEVLSQIRARQLHVIDTTCPIVRSAQKAARGLAEAGFDIIIFGEVLHPEVKGLLGWAGAKAIATLDEKKIAYPHQTPSKLGILSQTTQSQLHFTEFTNKVIAATLTNLKELRIINTLCLATQKRQEAATELAKRSELMIVVGGHNSANTQRLAEVCSAIVETHSVELASEIAISWLHGKHHIGITAGASTPDQAIQDIVLQLTSLANKE